MRARQLPSFFFRPAAVAVAALLLVPLVGCDNGLKGGGSDASMMTEGAEKEVKQPQGSGPLWPLPSGKRWQTLTYRNDGTSVASEMHVDGSYRLRDGRTGTMVRSYRGGKLFRVEVYQVSAAGDLHMLALGENEKKMLVFNPGIPFLKAPTKEGEELNWAGTARIEGKDYGATAFHRLSAIEDVKTTFDTLRAFRLDGIITLMNGNQRIDYPLVMWFVPGKGPAQRRLADQGKLAIEIITRF